MKLNSTSFFKFGLGIMLATQLGMNATSQIVPIGSGSYTKTFPGVDAASRNSFPSGTPYVSGIAATKPIPTNDWWSLKLKNPHVNNMFNYPMALSSVNSGMIVSYINAPSGAGGSSQPMDDALPVIVGVKDLNATAATVYDYSDFTVSLNWTNGTHNFNATTGIAMPFIYFTKSDVDIAQITVNEGTVTISAEVLIIENAHHGADFSVYAPAGSVWEQNGKVYTSTLNSKNYWSIAHLPSTASSLASAANEYKKYAYVFPTNTVTNWEYNENTGIVRTTFSAICDVKEGTETEMLLGLLPHQWGNLATNSPMPGGYSYTSIRGEIKTLAGNEFSVENTYHGIVPTLPYLNNYSEGFNPATLNEKIELIENDGLSTWTDSYNEGQVMNRLIQTARIADLTGDTEARDKMLATIKERLEDWLTAESGEVAFLFYYNTTWTTLLGYPAGHGQDGNINDHHFHWGYFIHAAAFVEQFEPGWANQWGEMINYLVRDAASPDRDDELFPFLRNFSPYAGHCWANGFATFPFGNDQESTSESMQFNSSLIHWGTITGNKEIRDLGIYLYTTEQTAIEEYWMDIHDRVFKPEYNFSMVSRVWCNGYDNQTFWTGDIAAVYGIEMYPIHGGSLYLGHDTVYVTKLWNEMKANTGIVNNEANPNLWHDIYWEYLAFIDPAKAIEMYNSNPNRGLKFGVSDAQTYHWLHAMNALGRVDASITANYPIAAAFNKDGIITYTAHNYSNEPISVLFSDGFELSVPANKMATNLDIDVNGVLSSDFDQAYPGGKVQLTLTASNGTPSKVEFMDGTNTLGTVTAAPFTYNASNLPLGVQSFYAKIYEGEKFNVSNSIKIVVGSQQPYGGTAWAIPGVIEAGKFDIFEGGAGQNISYMDADIQNSGDYRMNEYVDASFTTAEGAAVGWIAVGEWIEFTVNVEQSGLYSFDFRYASGNSAGGGPFHLELDGEAISENITVPSTSTTSWDVWKTKTVANIPLIEGEHMLRVAFSGGEFNLANMTFTKTGDIDYSYPIANAGSDIKVLWPLSSTVLDGSMSSESGAKALTFEWQQVYGPSVVTFSDKLASKPTVSNLQEGMYRFKLNVTNTDLRKAYDEVMVAVSSTDNILPVISLTSPTNNVSYPEGTQITLSANASDFDGTIQQVEFFQNDTLIGTVTSAPYTILFTKGPGVYTIAAKATDNSGGTAVSQTADVTFEAVLSCTESSTAALQGSFSVGYKYTFETMGTDVTVIFELFDDRSGVEAFLWNESPFSEKSMNNIGNKKFSTTLSNQTAGSTLSVACKFAYSGGQSVTQYVQYKVGDNCEADTEAPLDFTATVGSITPSSIQLLLNASDNSGKLVYSISAGNATKTLTAASGVETSYIITALKENTNYSYSVTVADIEGNVAANSPITLEAKTLYNNNTACNGSLAEASEGSFAIGYNYTFSTSGTDVNITYELLDTKSGVAAYLQNTTSAFEEIAMTNSSGKIFTAKLSNQTSGSVIKVACKFAYEGGMVVTKVQSYTVGDACDGTSVDSESKSNLLYYPNPVNDFLILQLQETDNIVTVFDLKGQKSESFNTLSSNFQVNMSKYKKGLYVLLIQNSQNIHYIKVVKE